MKKKIFACVAAVAMVCVSGTLVAFTSGETTVTVSGASCKHGGCECRAFKGIKLPTGRYKGSCTNMDGGGHRCGHSASQHGLPQGW